MEKLISLKCMNCGKSFEQPPHPSNGQAKYYTCPECRVKANEELKKKPARYAAGIYRSIRH